MEANIRKVKDYADYEIGGIENEILDGDEYGTAREFFKMPMEKQVEDIYSMIINEVEKECRFLGREKVNAIIERCLEKSEWNQ